MTRPDKTTAIHRLQSSMNDIPRLKRLQVEIQQLPQFKRVSGFPPEFQKWYMDTQVVIKNTFDDDKGHLIAFQNISYTLNVFSAFTTTEEYQQAYVRGLDLASSVLESMITEVSEYWPDNHSPAIDGRSSETAQSPLSNKVFLAHGRDDGARETIARFLERLELKPVILSESPARGRTIIEKFEEHTDVDFALAIMTPDDVGSHRQETDLKERARQNVVFELGFFIGKLGRGKVCAMTKGKPEIPSNYSGVEYIRLDDPGAWKMKLVFELKEAGFNVDANRVIGS